MSTHSLLSYLWALRNVILATSYVLIMAKAAASVLRYVGIRKSLF